MATTEDDLEAASSGSSGSEEASSGDEEVGSSSSSEDGNDDDSEETNSSEEGSEEEGSEEEGSEEEDDSEEPASNEKDETFTAAKDVVSSNGNSNGVSTETNEVSSSSEESGTTFNAMKDESSNGDGNTTAEASEVNHNNPAASSQTLEGLGLAAFLRDIDGPCPLNSEQKHYKATFQATSVRVDAARSLEVPIPIFVAHSKVDYKIGVEAQDVGYSIYCKKEANDDAEAEEEDDENNKVLLVEPSQLTAAAVEEEEPETIKSSGTASGSFEVDTTAPVVLEFDNSYSWITPKTVSYAFTVTPPPDKELAARAARAHTALQKVQTSTQVAETSLTQIKALVQECNTTIETMVQKKLVESRQKVAHQEDAIQAARVKSNDLQTLQEEMAHTIKSQQQHITQAEQQLETLDQKIKELQLERQARVEEKKEMVHGIQESQEQTNKFKEQQEQVKKEAANGQVTLEALRQDITATEKQVESTKEARSKAELDEKQAAVTVAFLKRQAEALRLRL